MSRTVRASRPRVAALAILIAVLTPMTLAACGGDEAGGEAGEGELTVSAASSLTEAFERYAEETPAVERFSFGGSDQLAAQIRQGAAPDVYAAADIALPQALYDEGLVEQPVVFATNTLVLAVPAGSDEVRSVGDLVNRGVDLILGAEDVPFGSYARAALDRLPDAQKEAILANVRSEESDVKAAVGKLTQGAADASFVYRSDVAAAGGQLDAIELPERLKPDVLYAVAVVQGVENRGGAREFVDGLLTGAGAEALEGAGFGPPPGTEASEGAGGSREPGGSGEPGGPGRPGGSGESGEPGGPEEPGGSGEPRGSGGPNG